MNKQLRRFIFIIFVILFFVLSAIILPYAFGYELNWSGMKLQRTGMFDIKTTPSGATIYLNGQAQQSIFGRLSGRPTPVTTPAKLANQTPGTYQIKLELDGYWPWVKQLNIRPNETTYLEDVYLFKKSSPQLLVGLASAAAAVESNDQKFVAALGPEALHIFSWDKSAAVTVIPLTVGANRQLVWSPDNEKIVVGGLVVDIAAKSIVDIKSAGIAPIGHVAWADKDLLYFQDRGGLSWLNLKTREKGLIVGNKTTISDFTVKDGYLYYTSVEPRASLNIRKLGDSLDKAKIKLSDSGTYNLINTPDNDLMIKNAANHNAYLINPGLLWLKNYDTQFIGPLTAWHFADKNRLIYANNFELYDWMKPGTSPTLLTRISYPILSIAWHKSNNYIIFATDRSLNTLELDDREAHNITNLLELPNLSYPLINKTGDAVIFFAQIDGVSGWYLLEI